jgi:hypothetical protein
LRDPAWSPDGTRIAFTYYQDGTFQPPDVVLVPSSGGSGANFSQNPANDFDSDWQPLHPPTAVTVVSFAAARRATGVVVRWRTAPGAPMLGFNVYRDDGRRLVKVNRSLIENAVAASKSHVYSLLDRATSRGEMRYRLQALGLSGATRWVGSTDARH